ncbi:hypothetical protein ABZP36_016200 [Zizania latifolia]
MDMLLSALASDIASRIISFLVAKYQKQASTEKMIRLHQLLLRARTIIQEADCRHISNQGMLLQLRQLRKLVFESYHVLDTFKGQAQVSSQSFDLNRIQVTMESLESTIGGLKEFAVFLMDCPRILRQPYSTYLFVERCMFGRHMEKHHIINFLMQSSGSPLQVLPVVGPVEIGKRTLVEHVLEEETVQRKFSRVVRLKSDDLNNLQNDGAMKRHKLISPGERCIIVVELEHDTDLMAWRRLHSSLSKMNIMSKVILISGLHKASKLGTTQALVLKRMHPDEFWYFFRTLCFGSENPDEHQVLLSIAMKIAPLMKGAFLCAHILSRLLRANLSAQYWRHILDLKIKGVKLHLQVFGEHSTDRIGKSRSYIVSNYIPDDHTVILCNSIHRRSRGWVDRGVPKIMVEDIINRSAAIPSEGEIEVLLWQSPIAPYYSYMGNCVIKKASQVVPKERGLKRKRRVMKA